MAQFCLLYDCTQNMITLIHFTHLALAVPRKAIKFNHSLTHLALDDLALILNV